MTLVQRTLDNHHGITLTARVAIFTVVFNLPVGKYPAPVRSKSRKRADIPFRTYARTIALNNFVVIDLRFLRSLT